MLGLVKAQMVKNAVIVPTGSKGGFYAKQLPDPAVDREAWLEEGIAAYRMFISGLLDITDNRVSGEAVPPEHVVRHDDDDTYLVVAADKGTATFSDIANGVAQSYGFWLDDAFASGGSAGYDHKAMGITARGAWESVKRHFREMGVDTQTQDFTVVGVGDMSGDVFGNGMLLSEHIRLVAAFDHRHVFVDPTPGCRDLLRRAAPPVRPAALLVGRLRHVADLRRWRRLPAQPKSIPIVAGDGRRRSASRARTTMTPAELIHAILLAPVDLLWNGGIGTYVKASTEDHLRVGDRANDAIRVDGKRAAGQGGRRGRQPRPVASSAASRRRSAGVRVNTDAIDNSRRRRHLRPRGQHQDPARRAWSARATSPPKQRNELLASMTDDVAAARAARQLRAERAARQRPGAGALDADRARAAHPLARGARRPRPGAGVPADRRRDREAGARRAWA